MSHESPATLLLAVLAITGAMLAWGQAPLLLLLAFALLPLAVSVLSGDGVVTLAAGIPLSVLASSIHPAGSILTLLLLLNAVLWILGTEWRGYGLHAFLAIVPVASVLALLQLSFGLLFAMLAICILVFFLAFAIAGAYPLVQEVD